MELLDMHNTLKSKAERKELGDIRVNTGGKKSSKKLLIRSERSAKMPHPQNNKRTLLKK